jgi:hypothetical protein
MFAAFEENWKHCAISIIFHRLHRIVNEKKLIVRGGLGYANMEKQIKPDENTVYHLASITKNVLVPLF